MIGLQALPALVMWAVVSIRVYGLWLGWKPGVLPAAALVAPAMTLDIDPVYMAVDQLLGGHNLLNLIIHLLIGAGLTQLSRMLLQATGHTNRRSYIMMVVAGGVLVLAQVALVAVSDTQGSATRFTDTFADIPTVALYQASFFAWVGLVFGYTGMECHRRDAGGESRAFGIGFDFVSLGCLIGVGTVVVKLLLIALVVTETEAAGFLYTLYKVLVGLTIIFIAVGFMLPALQRLRSAYSSRSQRAVALDLLRPIVSRLAKTDEGRRSLDAAHIHLDARSSGTQLYRWLIFVGDIRVLDPGLLSEQERAITDAVGRDFEHREDPEPTSHLSET